MQKLPPQDTRLPPKTSWVRRRRDHVDIRQPLQQTVNLLARSPRCRGRAACQPSSGQQPSRRRTTTSCPRW